jgi:cytochrome P450
MVPTITASIADSMAAWAGPAQAGTPIDVAAEMATLTLAVLGRALLGVNLADDVAPLARAFAVAATSGPLQRRMSVYQALQRSQEVADPALVDAARVVDTIVRRLIDDRRQTGDGAADLLTRLVFDRETDERGRLVTDEQLLMVVRVLLIAGHSAASSALAWTFHLVGEHPLVRARLESEIHTVLAGRVPMASDLPLLRYTRMVLLEAMRLYPPVWMLLPRRAARADRLGGYDIPRGTKVVISPWVLHRHPEFWARPEEFNPDRFSRTEPRAFLPFGAGPWGCVGTQFGLTEARLALAMAIQRYSWAAAVPGRPVVPDPQVALWPRDGLPMLFQQREKGSGQAPP